MNLLFIYGPPASGKLTISEVVAERTDYRLFHNHQTRDLVQDIYPDTLRDNYGLVNKLRLDVFKYTAEHDTNLIFTFVYDGPEDCEFVDKVVETVEKHGGKVLFVELSASNDTLLERVDNDSRKLHKKLVDKIKLEEILNTNMFESMPYEDIFNIDTTESSPLDTALSIIDHYKL